MINKCTRTLGDGERNRHHQAQPASGFIINGEIKKMLCRRQKSTHLKRETLMTALDAARRYAVSQCQRPGSILTPCCCLFEVCTFSL